MTYFIRAPDRFFFITPRHKASVRFPDFLRTPHSLQMCIRDRLCTGLQAYNDQGIAKLVEAVNGDVGGLIARFRATCDVAKDYRSFSGISDEMDGRVKFIYRTDAIERE